MKFVMFTKDGGSERLGAMDGEDSVADLGDAGLGTLMDVISGGSSAMEKATSALDSAPRLALSDLRIVPPLRPSKILCSGVNYDALVIEAGLDAPPAQPFFFAKLPSSLSGQDDEVAKPAMSDQIDWEVEFSVVIGKRLHKASEAEVMDAVFGYTLLNDISARDVQARDNQITLGKNFPGFAPIGPCVVTTDEMSDTSDIRVTCDVNGKRMQDDTTANWCYSIPKMVSFLSQVMPLEPGDIMTTGTTAGLGLFMDPQVWLKPGDVVEVSASGIGSLRTHIVAE